VCAANDVSRAPTARAGCVHGRRHELICYLLEQSRACDQESHSVGFSCGRCDEGGVAGPGLLLQLNCGRAPSWRREPCSSPKLHQLARTCCCGARRAGTVGRWRRPSLEPLSGHEGRAGSLAPLPPPPPHHPRREEVTVQRRPRDDAVAAAAAVLSRRRCLAHAASAA
jgi:hypothetical protein